MSGYRIDLEAGRGNILASCSACPPWRELRNSRGPVLEAAARHAELVHGDARRAAALRESARRWQARHAERGGDPS